MGHRIGTDHALLTAPVTISRTPARWAQDSKPRFVHSPLPSVPLVDVEDISALARTCTKPFPSMGYKDPDVVLDAIRLAQHSKQPGDWKKVHKLRKLARHEWEAKRIECILKGDWAQYRQRKRQLSKRSGWWGTMLEACGEEELAQKTKDHLASKLCGPPASEWDEKLDALINQVQVEKDWTPFTLQEVQGQLAQMKPRSSVGPDGIGVDLLRKIAETELLSEDLVDIINHIVQHAAVPESWNKSLLALLAKVDVPKGPQDLRPIAMSSAMQKLVSRLVMTRAFPLLRGGTDICCSGKSRQAADLVGCLTHLRDVVKEWRLPMLIAKLDIRGAFDSLGRHALASYLLRKLQHCAVGRELRYLLLQVRPNLLLGRVPGGEMLDLCCTTGIRQGSPESAELFALVLQDALEDMMHSKAWRSLGVTIPELNVELLMYQDDLFLWDDDAGRLTKRLELINDCLRVLGLQLAAKKTAITSSNDYVGARRILFLGNQIDIQSPSQPIRVLGLNFTFDGDSTRQARELIARLRAAFREHRELLCGRASWDNKVFAVKRLVLSTISWVAGAVYWGPQDLATLNTLQMHVMRDVFLLRRHQGETWVDYNQRTMRFVRAWMHTNGCARWSTTATGADKLKTMEEGCVLGLGSQPASWHGETWHGGEANNAFPLQRVVFVTLDSSFLRVARGISLNTWVAIGCKRVGIVRLGVNFVNSGSNKQTNPGVVVGNLHWHESELHVVITLLFATFGLPSTLRLVMALAASSLRMWWVTFLVLWLDSDMGKYYDFNDLGDYILFYLNVPDVDLDFFDFDLNDFYEHFDLFDFNDFSEHFDLFDLCDLVDSLEHSDLLDFSDFVDLDVLRDSLAYNLAVHRNIPYDGVFSPMGEFVYGVHWMWEDERGCTSTTTSTTPGGEVRWHGTGIRESSTTSTTTPDGPAAEGELGDYSPDATGEELETLSLQELVDQELLGGANQSGQLLMDLDQHPSEFAVVNEPPPNRPTTIDWTHDVLHNLAQRVLDDTIGAQRYGHPPTVRWGAHIAAAEFRDVGRMFTRLGDMIVNSIDRPVDEPRTPPPTNEPMYRHYRAWSRRWRDMFLGVIREFLQHTDAEAVEHQARLRVRDDQYRRMAELRDLERYRTPQRTGPDPGLGVPVARRPSGAMGGKRSHGQMTAEGDDRGRSSTDTFPGPSPLEVVPPRPKFRMPTPSPSEEARGVRPVQTPDLRPPSSGSRLGVGLASPSSWPQGLENRGGLHGGATIAWDGPITSLTSSLSTASSSVGCGTHASGETLLMPTTPIMPPPSNASMPLPTPPVPDQRPPATSSASLGETRPSAWDHHNNLGTPTIPPVPIVTAVTPVTPFDERGRPITPVIPSAPVITSATPMTPFPEDVPEVDDVIQEICGPSSSSTTTTGVPGLGLPFSNSSTTTPRGMEEEVDYGEQDEHVPSDEVEVAVEEDGAAAMGGDEEVALGEQDTGEDDLSPREERLARRVAGLVVAEVYHLLRTTGVIAGPGMPTDRDVRVDIQATSHVPSVHDPSKLVAR
ncbi:unnamed protein product, partial [Symbiodinium necroappetens]